jgi:hypothetical protein
MLIETNMTVMTILLIIKIKLGIYDKLIRNFSQKT